MTFNTQPSDEFARLTAELADLKSRYLQPDLSIDQSRAIREQIEQVFQALKAAPERQFLDEVKDDEVAAYDQAMAAELAGRGANSF